MAGGSYSGLEAPGLVSSKQIGPSGTTEYFNKTSGWMQDPHANEGSTRTAYNLSRPGLEEYYVNYAGGPRNIAGTSVGTPRGGGGGGGGGGGAPAYQMSDEAYRAMLALANSRPGQLGYGTPYAGPQYQGMDIEPWNDTRYRMMGNAMGEAYDQAGNRIGTGADTVRSGLASNWDAYNQMRAAQQMTQTPQMATQVSSLGVNPNVIREGNANAAAADRAFQNYLAANEMRAQAGQSSRLTEADIAEQYALNELAASRMGNELQLGLAEQGSWEDYLRRQNERRYQDSQIGQTWGRDDALMNWQNIRDTDIANFGVGEESRQARQKALLELVGLADQYGLDINPADFGL